ncbi:MAG: putative lipoprotein with Yx(FWY)xxD motif [Acidimicrobiales bacterium]|jgi:predicted lipoprotein with Yx(FWY)xxD motif
MLIVNDNPTRSRRSARRFGAAWASLVGAALVIAACGGSDAAAPAAEEPVAEAAPAAEATTPAVVAPAATIGETDLGDVLVGERGLTLYGFTNDVDATSVCYGACADAWPPVIVGADWGVAPGLDEGIFNAIVRDDGQLQLVAGKWPLYYFAGDATAGDVNGQTSGEVWFAVGTDGVLIEGALGSEPATEVAAAEGASLVTTGDTDLGSVLVDADGLTLYGFTEDVEGLPTCNDACADAWPPYLVGDSGLPAGLDEAVFSVVTREDGSNQLKAGAWPLYYFAGDAAPGETNGQASGDVWFVVTADGGLVDAAASGETDDGY